MVRGGCLTSDDGIRLDLNHSPRVDHRTDGDEGVFGAGASDGFDQFAHDLRPHLDIGGNPSSLVDDTG